jgi:citrate/tricarballylate utilization protein
MTSAVIASDRLTEARRVAEICNACRYCEGFCATFPAMTQYRTFDEASLEYLANLCHNCNACYHACQYAPPHEFGVNIPQALAELRADVYEKWAWPGPFARLLERNGLVVSVVTALSLGAIFSLLLYLQDSTAVLSAHNGPGAFYAVIGHGLMVAVASSTFLFSILALAIGMYRFAQSIDLKPPTWVDLSRAGHDVASMRYLGGHDNDGCNTSDASFSNARRIYHQLAMWGFLLCFAATCVATVYDYVFGLVAPYPFFSIPVLLGTFGGVGLGIGCIGLLVIKHKSDPQPMAASQRGMDYALLVLLLAVSLTGLILLALRETSAMGLLLALHLGVVLAFFLLMPYSKFVHAGYRFVALLKNAQSERLP